MLAEDCNNYVTRRHSTPRRTAAILAGAAFILFFGVWSGRAQPVTLQTGYNFVGCHVNGPGGNSVNNNAFLQVPATLSDPTGAKNAVLYVWNCTAFNTYQYYTSADAATQFGSSFGDGWYDAGGSLAPTIWNPGEGMIIENFDPPAMITFSGTPATPVFPPTNYCGCNRWSLLCPQTTNAFSTYQNVTGFPPAQGAQVSFDYPTNGILATDTYSNGVWSPNTPILTNNQAAFFWVPCTNTSTPCCPDNGGVKYLQPPNLVNGVDVNATFSPTDPINFLPWVLADDFPCTNSGPITDIHIWGSWLYDQVDANAVFTLAIWSDAPTSAANQFSHPDQLLWTQTYSNGQYALCPYTNTLENFVDGSMPGLPNQLGSSSNLYYLCFDASPANTFYQTGTATAPTNYWLSVTVQSTASTTPYYFGWKSSSVAYNDAAVAASTGNFYPLPTDWNPMTDSQGLALNMAFKITTATNPCSLGITCPSNIVVSACTNVQVFYTPTVTNNCCGTNVALTCNPPSGSYFAPGTTTPVFCQVVDCNGLSNSCTFTVTVIPQVGITMHCASNKTVYCGQSWQFDPFGASSCCATNLMHILNTTTSGICPQVITRTYAITNVCGGSNYCSQTVTVVDTNPPTILCPSNIVVTACTNIPVFYAVQATDLCSTNLSVICSPPSGSYFLPGVTTVNCSATNCVGTANCSFTVTVQCVTNTTPCCPDTGGVKYLQPPNLVNGIDVNANFSPVDPFNGLPWVLADDFPCTNSGPITDIHLWGSWLYDQVDYNAVYTLAIWSDVPTSTANPFSHPGLQLWTQSYSNGQYTLCPFTNKLEFFYVGDGGLNGVASQLGSSSNLYYLCFDANPTNTFVQMGTSTAPTNYWLSVTVQSANGPVQRFFGWKSSSIAYNDAAVAAFNGNFNPLPTDWYPMADAQGLPLNMAFKITTSTNSSSSNCCDNCVAPYPLSYNVTFPPGVNVYLANNLCQGTNNTLSALLAGVPNNTIVSIWNGSGYVTSTKHLGVWNPNFSLSPGQGFVIKTPAGTAPLNLTISGCPPICPPPCMPPTNVLSLVGGLGIGVATWTNLFSCPPPCGAQMLFWNGNGFTEYDFYNQAWHDVNGNVVAAPVLGIGQSVFVSVQPNTNCCPTVMHCPSNIVVTACTDVQVLYTATATNSCCSNTIPVVFTPASGSYFAPGTVTTVNCSAIDCNGISNNCSFTVTVSQPPSSLTVVCPTNMTVSCGSTWSFNPPTATTTCCNSNVTIISLGSVTNGSCPQYITNTWVIYDSCGNSNTCRQGVTLVSCVPVPSGLVGWWPGDNNPNDLSSYANNATLQNGATYAPGMVASAFSFPGASNLASVTVAVPVAGSLDFSTNVPFTIDAWVNTTSTGTAIIVDKRSGTGNQGSTYGYSLYVYGGNLGFQLGSGLYGNYIAAGPLINDGQWHFVALTVDRAAKLGRLYVDNVLVLTANTAAVEGNVSNTGGFLIGQRNISGPVPFAGSIDEVEVFNRLLLPAEMAAIYNAGSAGKCKSPELVCATNKTVQCGAAWTFDAPAVNSCGGAGGSPVVLSTVTNGVCSQTITRTWLFVDACGYSNFCSQVVTLANTNPPVITSPANLTVPCGTTWNFTTPTATDPCGGSNVIVIAQTPATNGLCPMLITETWIASNQCNGLTAIATQTVKVVSCVPPPSGMVLWLPFDETSGTISANLAGINNGTQFNGPTVNLGNYVANSLCFNGVNQYVEVPDYAGINIGTGNFSVDAWVKPATLDSTIRIIVDHRAETSTTVGYSLFLGGNNTIGFQIGDGNFVNYPSTFVVPADGQWHQVAVTVNRSLTNGIHFFLDGVVGALGRDPTPYSGSITPPPSYPFRVSSRSSSLSGFFPGCIDEVEVFTRELAVAEVQSLFNAGSAGKCKSPKLVCPLPKSVPCGTTITFDTPTVTNSCCGTNAAVVPFGSDLNGGTACAPTLTRTWLYVDCCGNSNFCSQTVTIVNSNTACSPLLARAGLTNISVWEQTGPSVQHLFPVGSSALRNPIAGGPSPTTNDFSTTSLEYYDVFISDPDGTPDTNGCCLTIVCDYLAGGVNGASGGNIDSVELNFSNGTTLGASSVGNIQLGGGITDPALLASSGWATNALGLHDGNSTRMGQGLARITVCFPADCSTAKTVQCGSHWTFDPPPAYNSCCGSNITVTVLNTVTNGTSCNLVILRTWEVTDCCSNKSTCTETVTVVDTTPPTITCKTNLVVVALNTNCQLVIPAVSASATDNCTPTSQLVFKQSPTNGTIVAGTSYSVTVTVFDLCGNSNSCYVKVVGVDKTGPVLTGPTSVTVTNCLVPCVLNLVTAVDNCCPPLSLVKSQSPPCNTPLGPGINSVTVTVKDCHGNISTKVIHLNVAGPTSFLTVLTNTGVAINGSLLAPGAVDPHYTLGPVPVATPGYVAPNAVAVTTVWGWLELIHVSEWIAPTLPNIYSCPAGNYTYTNQFVLPPGANPTTASISGRWAADDGATMYFNGVLQGANTIPVLPVASGFNHWHPLTITSGFLANPSKNTILFVVTNSFSYSPGPTGLRVEYTNALVNCYTCSPPAIVSITSGFSVPNNGIAGLSVAASGTPPLSYQWYDNGVKLFNLSPYSGVSTANLLINPIHYANAGLYTVVISNACGSVTGKVQVAVSPGWPWSWGWWNVAQLASPLAATYGPNLMLSGPSYALSAGSTADFGLPDPGGQIVNVMDVPPLPAGTAIQVPVIAPTGSNSVNSYSLVMDLYEPGASAGISSILFKNSCCLGSTGEDGVGFTMDTQNYLHLTGYAAGVPFDVASSLPLPVDAWNRVACVIDDPQDGVGLNLNLYLNGQSVASLYVPTSSGLPVNWNSSPPTLLSRQTNDLSLNGEFYVSSIQFHAVALTPDQIAGIGSPDNGTAPVNDPSVGPAPVLAATMAGGSINFTWGGSPYVLQETTDLTSGEWTDSALAFTENADGSVTTAVANPATEGRTKFYRLVFRP